MSEPVIRDAFKIYILPNGQYTLHREQDGAVMEFSSLQDAVIHAARQRGESNATASVFDENGRQFMKVLL